MTVTPRDGYVALKGVELTDKSVGGLLLPTRTQALEVLASAVQGIDVGTIVMLCGKEQLSKLELPTGTVLVAPGSAICATIDGA